MQRRRKEVDLQSLTSSTREALDSNEIASLNLAVGLTAVVANRLHQHQLAEAIRAAVQVIAKEATEVVVDSVEAAEAAEVIGDEVDAVEVALETRLLLQAATTSLPRASLLRQKLKVRERR